MNIKAMQRAVLLFQYCLQIRKAKPELYVVAEFYSSGSNSFEIIIRERDVTGKKLYNQMLFLDDDYQYVPLCDLSNDAAYKHILKGIEKVTGVAFIPLCAPITYSRKKNQVSFTLNLETINLESL